MIDRKYTCIVCGDKTHKPFQAAFEHFWFYESGQWQFLRGNIATFGFWDGLNATLGLAFPFYNTLRHWKYRKHRLVIPKDADIDVG